MKKKADEFVTVAGRKLVAPILPDGVKLCRPIEEYFPDRDPEVWFAMTVAEQDRWVVESVFGGQCAFLGLPLPGETVDGHHLVHRAPMGKPARAPWDIIAIMRSPNQERNIHGFFHPTEPGQMAWCVYRYDFLDRDGGLVVADEKEERIPNGHLHFYSLPSHDQVVAAQEWLRLSMAEYCALTDHLYRLGALTVAGDDHAVTLGFGTVKACFAQYGIDNFQTKTTRKIMDEMSEYWEKVMDARVPPRVADAVRKLPDNVHGDWIEKAVQMCAPIDFTKRDDRVPSLQDFFAELGEEFPAEKRPMKVSIVPSSTEVKSREVDDIEDIEDDGIVFRGEPVKRL